MGGGDADPQAYLNADQRGGTAPNGKPSMTVDQAGLHLIGGEPGWSVALGVAYTVTYAFRSTAPATMPEDTGGFSRFNAAQITQAELALLAWSDVANINFTRVGSGTSGEAAFSNSASILLGNYSSGAAGAAAFANYPGSPSASSSAGDVWVNNTLSYNRNPVQGNYGGLVLVHELGHTIGLSHPGDYDASDGLPITYANDAEYYEDSAQYTVMSYFDETDTGGDYHGAYAASLMLDDISAAQQEYGVNLTTRTGDTVYGFNSTADRPWYLATSASTKLIFAAWDAGGNDTFDFSGFGVAQTIDLREGFFSSVGGLVGNVAVAKGAAIENAIGGSGADGITGNALANALTGAAGADVLNGLGGDDLLQGDAGNDVLNGGDGGDTVSYASAATGVTVDLAVTAPQETGDGQDTLISVEFVLGSSHDDVVSGDNGGNALQGGGGQDWLVSRSGDDVLVGGDGNDSLWGGDGFDTIDGGLGDDVIDGGAGYDTVSYASAAAGVEIDLRIIEDQLTRGAGVDTLISIENVVGSAFADMLTGDAGVNLFTGGAGDDHFVFYPGSGADQVTDFGAGGAHDLLDLASFFAAGVTWSITQVAADTVVGFATGDSIILTAFDHNHLQASGDFFLVAV